MTALTAINIPKPKDWQAFERAAVELWQGILGDDGIHRYGRTGQAQYGLDLVGYRDLDAKKLVGIQCKCVSMGGSLDEKMVRDEVEKALKHKADLREYYVITTAEDSTDYAELAMELTKKYSDLGKNAIIRIWGWSTLEERIIKYPNAHKAFDPSYSPYVEKLLSEVNGRLDRADERLVESTTLIVGTVQGLAANYGQSTAIGEEPPGIEASHNAELDRYRAILMRGQVKTALALIYQKEADLPSGASKLLRCRLKALAGHCNRILGRTEVAIEQFEEAIRYAPDDARARSAFVTAAYLRGEFQEGYDAGLKALADDPTNEGVVAWTLLAAARLEGQIDPISVIPAGLQEKASFAEARVDYLRAKDVRPLWWTEARSLSAKFPDNLPLRFAAADSHFDEILGDADFQATGRLTDDWRERLSNSVETEAAALTELYGSETPNRADGACLALNSSAMLMILKRSEAAKEIIDKALDHYLDNTDVVLRAAQIAANTGDKALQDKALPLLSDEPSDLAAKVQILYNQGRWPEVAEIGARHSFYAPSRASLVPTHIIVRCAQIRVGQRTKAAKALKKLVEKYPGNPSDLIVVVQCARDLGFPDIAQSAYDKLKSSISDDSHYVQRVNVSHAAQVYEDWDTVVEVLGNHVDLTTDSDDLRLLAHALTSLVPVPVRALNFFKGLSPDVRGLEYYARGEAHALYNAGDLKAALKIIEGIPKSEPADVPLLILECYCLDRLRKKDALVARIAATNTAGLAGSPMNLMQVAHLFKKNGRALDGLALGYLVALSNPQDPVLQLKYCGLLLMEKPGERTVPEVTTVADGTWIKIVDADGNEDNFLIDSEAPNTLKDIVDTDSPRATPFIGKSIDDEVELALPMQGAQVWKIVEIKSRYVYLLNDIIGHFNSRFPGHKGFQSFSVRENDVQFVYDAAKAKAENAPDFGHFYQTTGFPIAALAALHGQNTIQLLGYLETTAAGINTCAGQAEEREDALNLTVHHLGGGAVLDITALWTVFNIGAWDVFQNIFGEIHVPQTTLEELNEIRAELDDRLGSNGGNLSYVDGAFYFTEFSDEDTKKALNLMDERVGAILGQTTPAPAPAPDKSERIARQILEKLGDQFIFDPAFLAVNDKRIFITEDRCLGAMVKGLFDCSSTWIQPVLTSAKDLGLIGIQEYAEFCGKLAALRHGFVSCDATALFALAGAESPDFAHAIQYIGNKDADMASHAGVVIEFMTKAWRSLNPETKILRACGALLQSLMRFRGDEAPVWIAIIFLQCRRVPMAQNYLSDWCRGHFYRITEGQMGAATEWMVRNRPIFFQRKPRRSDLRYQGARSVFSQKAQ